MIIISVKKISFFIFYINTYFFIITQASPLQLTSYKLTKNDSNLEATVLGINFAITHQHFLRGKLKVSEVERHFGNRDNSLCAFSESNLH